MIESSFGSSAAALFSSGVRLTARIGDSMPAGLPDLVPAASPADKPLLLALRGVGRLRGADAGPPSTVLPCCRGSAALPVAVSPPVPLALLLALYVLRMLLLGCSMLEALHMQPVAKSRTSSNLCIHHHRTTQKTAGRHHFACPAVEPFSCPDSKPHHQ